jgi:hypothetical protein
VRGSHISSHTSNFIGDKLSIWLHSSSTYGVATAAHTVLARAAKTGPKPYCPLKGPVSSVAPSVAQISLLELDGMVNCARPYETTPRGKMTTTVRTGKAGEMTWPLVGIIT